MIHDLKTINPYFTDLVYGNKSFEVRKNDRDFKVGDGLHLMEYEDGNYTGHFIFANVIYLLPGGQFGIEPDYVILGIHTSGPKFSQSIKDNQR